MWIEILGFAIKMARRFVTPLAGVWIEILGFAIKMARRFVTPLAGVWIEIPESALFCTLPESLPLRECGLKS